MSIDNLEDFAKTILEDEELFNNLCELVGIMFELSNIHGKACDEMLEKIYGIKNENA